MDSVGFSLWQQTIANTIPSLFKNNYSIDEESLVSAMKGDSNDFYPQRLLGLGIINIESFH
jgi:hypothetical protein